MKTPITCQTLAAHLATIHADPVITDRNYRPEGFVPMPGVPGAWVSAKLYAEPVPVFFWLGASPEMRG